MPHTKQPVQPLAASVAPEVLDWDHVEPRHIEIGKDILGLSAADRRALGLAAPRAGDLEAPGLGGAEIALADVLARSGAVGKTDLRRKN